MGRRIIACAPCCRRPETSSSSSETSSSSSSSPSSSSSSSHSSSSSSSSTTSTSASTTSASSVSTTAACACSDLPDTLTATLIDCSGTPSAEFTLTRDGESCSWSGEWVNFLGTAAVNLSWAAGVWTLTADCFAGTATATVNDDVCGPVDLLFTFTSDPTFCCSFGGTTFQIHVTE